MYRRVILINNPLSSNLSYEDKSGGYTTSELPNEGP